MHEFKHVLDHPVRHVIQGDHKLSADEMAERVADYFAACVLMPKAWVKSAYFGGMQSVEALAARFQVSPKAMSVRLGQLGLTQQVDRCSAAIPTAFRRPTRSGRTYFRSLPTPVGALL
jgi:Zn-dependent peptidase ImmA (M78 family)